MVNTTRRVIKSILNDMDIYFDEEKKFVLNLTRLCGSINAVSVDFMFDTLAYINSKAVVEALFIEANYLGTLFDDDEFLQQGGILVDSLQHLINRYEVAKRNSDNAFLTLLHQKHREARAFLNDEVVKQQIKDMIEVRKRALEHKATWTTITHICGLLQHFPHCNLAKKVLAPLLPQMVQTIDTATAVE